MAIAGAYLRETNSAREDFEAAIQYVGQQGAKRAFSRALNHVAAKANTQVKRHIAKQSGIKYGDVSNSIRLKRANVNRLEASIVGRGAAFPLKYFNARQFSYGVRANPWGQAQRFNHAFIIRAYSGDVFVRQDKDRFPIRKLWGPAIPNEMLRTSTLDLFARSTEELRTRAAHEVQAIISGYVQG